MKIKLLIAAVAAIMVGQVSAQGLDKHFDPVPIDVFDTPFGALYICANVPPNFNEDGGKADGINRARDGQGDEGFDVAFSGFTSFYPDCSVKFRDINDDDPLPKDFE